MVNIVDVGPSPASFSTDPRRCGAGRILSLAIASDDQRLYAGTYCGVWRSDDAGRTWRQLTRPQNGSFDANVPGALYAPYVLDLVVSPANPDIVLAAGAGTLFNPSRNGIYRTTDGGASWSVVKVLSGASTVGQVAFAPDDASLAIAAAGGRGLISSTSGASWNTRLASTPDAAHVVLGPLEPSGIRRAYAAGPDAIWYSIDGGQNWKPDLGCAYVTANRKFLSDYRIQNTPAGVKPPDPIPPFGQAMGDALSVGAKVLAIEPGNPSRVYLAAYSGTLGPTYYAPTVPDGTPCNVHPERYADEGSMWIGDFSNFETTGFAHWEMVPGPPVYWGGSTPSGTSWVIAQPTASGYLLFFGDESHVHVSAGQPIDTWSWHRVDGRDASAAKRQGDLSNKLFVHADPHALVVTSDFDLTLRVPTDVPAPYNRDSELDQHLGGTIWMANDGGVVWSDDGAQSWHAANGLQTVDPINLAGLPRTNGPPNLYIGTGDNDSFFSGDGGQTWKNGGFSLGDADGWFADAAKADWVVQFTPRASGIGLWTGNFADASDSGNAHALATPNQMDATNYAHNVGSRFIGRGYRPLILTLASEAAEPNGDFVLIGVRNGERALLRTRRLKDMVTPADWDDSSKAEQIGPPLPQAGITVVQASGGHTNPRYFVSNGNSLWTLRDGQWVMIVAGGPSGRKANSALRFFVDPYNPDLIYILDSDRIRLSLDGGSSWLDDINLTLTMTGNGRLGISTASAAAILSDMLFVRSNRSRRFALGGAGVMMTDNGVDWQCLVNSIALPSLPQSAFYDGVSDPSNPSLYVMADGRSVMRLDIPPPPPPQPPGVHVELAAILHEA
jgi:photosystem II stability/assembly factor-like uncharacterized protein